ncbi:MAG: acyl-CoA dehydrogenase family protein [Acidimicrobiales bacterium]
MDYTLGERAESLRARLRQLIHEHLPGGFLGAFSDDPADLATTQRFCKTLAEEGLLALAWPTEYGGGGASVWEQTVVREEMWAHNEPRGPQYMGINWVGPAIMRHGTAAQKAKHLPAIAGGSVIWCQGFSEPDAGSDLASLTTRADAVGDGWRITGQKVWTSYALLAQWCVLAARTSRLERKQDGITLFLIPMDRDGVSVQPIDSMLGPHHLNEVYLDDVPAYPEDVLGEVGYGWSVIRDALNYERVGIARYARCERLLAQTPVALGERWEEVPETTKVRWARALVHARVARLLAYRVIDAQAKGDVVDHEASIARVAVTRCDQEVADVLADIVGSGFVDDRSSPQALLGGGLEDHWRYSQAATIASGTIEIQRMLVARSVLGGAQG